MLFLDKLVSFPVLGTTLIAPSFWTGLPIVPGVLLAYAFQAWFFHFTLGVYLAKRTRTLIWIDGVGAAITVALNLILVPRLGLWGAVWAAVVCYAVMATLITRKSQALFPIEMAWNRLIPTLAWMGLCFAAGFWVQAHPETGWGLRLALLAAGLALPLILGAVTAEEKRLLLGLARIRKSAPA
jgi:O-antigen/teichoic acid export membrane protein